MLTVQPCGDGTPDEPLIDRVTSDLEHEMCRPGEAPEYVSLNELLDGAAVVTSPPCREAAPRHRHRPPVWAALVHGVLTEGRQAWRAALLLAVLAAAVSAVLLAGSLAIKTTALSAAALLLLTRLGKVAARTARTSP